MARTSSFEVYTRQGGDWVLAAVYPEREPAMVQARGLLDRSPDSEVQILEEILDPGRKDVVTALVFRGNHQALLNRDLRRSAPARSVPRQHPPAAAADNGRATRAIVLAASAAAIGAAGLTVLGMWMIRHYG